jgi:hypothetical protein
VEPLNHDAAALGRWKREHAALEHRLETARTFRGLSASAAPVNRGVRLRRGERLFLVVERVGLVEPGELPVDQAAVVDRGTATITNRRLVFEGTTRTREWAFGKLVEHRHYERRPTTVIEVTNRKRLSGITYDASSAADVRFSFDLALAHHTGTLDAFEGELERQLVRHDAQPPGVHAGAWVWRGWARPVPVASALLTAIVVTAALVVGGGPDDTARLRALTARGTDAFTSVEFESAAPSRAPADPSEEPPPSASGPVIVTAFDRAGGSIASTRPPPTAPAPPPGCAPVAVIGPASIPDPICSLTP